MHLMDIEILLTQGNQTHHLKAHQISVERNSRHCNPIRLYTIFSAIIVLKLQWAGKSCLYTTTKNSLLPLYHLYTTCTKSWTVYSIVRGRECKADMDRAICILALHTALCHCQLYQSQNTLKSWQSHHHHPQSPSPTLATSSFFSRRHFYLLMTVTLRSL